MLTSDQPVVERGVRCCWPSSADTGAVDTQGWTLDTFYHHSSGRTQGWTFYHHCHRYTLYIRWCHYINTFSQFVNKFVNSVAAMLPERWWPILSPLSIGQLGKKGRVEIHTDKRMYTLQFLWSVFTGPLVMDNEAHVTWTKTCVPSSGEFSWINQTRPLETHSWDIDDTKLQ